MPLNFLFFFSLFPLWILHPDINYLHKVFFFIPFFFIFIFIKLIKFEKKKSTYYYLIISLIIVFGLDQNLYLYINIIKPNFNFINEKFKIIYIFEILFISLLVSIIYILLKKLKEKEIIFFKIYTSFIAAIFFFNIFNIVNYSTEQLETSYQKNIFNKKRIVLVFDEMSGISSFETNYDYGAEFRSAIIDFAKKYNFVLYINSYSVSDNTANSISNLFNSKKNEKRDDVNIKKIREKSLVKSQSQNYEYDIIQNNFFDKYKSISVIQNIHLNYCLNKNVKKCYRFNPYLSTKLKYLDGFKLNYFSEFFSLWKINGSIFSRLFWKIMVIFNFGNSLLEPEVHKAQILNLFDIVKNDIVSNNFDLVYAHILVPHIPYAWTKDCKYDGKLINFRNFMNNKERAIQHNIERKCVFIFLNNFFEDLSNSTSFENLEFIILSDHGSRIGKNFDQSYSSILLTKKNSPYQIIREKFLIQDLFIK
jgi:hypothetical protein